MNQADVEANYAVNGFNHIAHRGLATALCNPEAAGLAALGVMSSARVRL